MTFIKTFIQSHTYTSMNLKWMTAYWLSHFETITQKFVQYSFKSVMNLYSMR